MNVNLSYQELAKSIYDSCLNIAQDGEGNNGTTYLDYHVEDIDLYDLYLLEQEILKLDLVLQVEFNNTGENDVCIVFDFIEVDDLVEIVVESNLFSQGNLCYVNEVGDDGTINISKIDSDLDYWISVSDVKKIKEEGKKQ